MSALDTRRKMAALLTTDTVQARISRLGVNPGEFCADVMEAAAQNDAVAALDVSEVLAVCELAAKLGLSFAPGRGDAHLFARRGHTCVLLGFSGLYALNRRLNAGSSAPGSRTGN